MVRNLKVWSVRLTYMDAPEKTSRTINVRRRTIWPVCQELAGPYYWVCYLCLCGTRSYQRSTMRTPSVRHTRESTVRTMNGHLSCFYHFSKACYILMTGLGRRAICGTRSYERSTIVPTSYDGTVLKYGRTTSVCPCCESTRRTKGYGGVRSYPNHTNNVDTIRTEYVCSTTCVH
jgi:hypothetical protein